MTPWDLYQELKEYESERDDEVKDLLRPAKLWSLLAATRKSANAEDTSFMSETVQPLAVPSKRLKAVLKSRLNTTLGARPMKTPDGPAPSFNMPSSRQAG